MDAPTLELAQRMGVADAVGSDPHAMLADADMVVLACPLPEIVAWLKRLPEYVAKTCVVLGLVPPNAAFCLPCRRCHSALTRWEGIPSAARKTHPEKCRRHPL